MTTSSFSKQGKLKLVLGIGGVLCLALAGGMFFMGQIGKGSHPDNLIFFVVLVVLGLGSFIAIEWLSAQATPLRRIDDGEDDRLSRAVKARMEEEEDMLASDGMGMTEEGLGGLDAAASDSTATPEGVGDFTSTVSANHLEQADLIYSKVFEIQAEQQLVEMIHQAVRTLQSKGYSGKGLSAFLDKLQSNLYRIDDSMPEQVVRNRSQGIQTIAELQRAIAAS